MDSPISMTLPNGVKIMAIACGYGDITKDEESWSSVDIVAEYPDGTIDELCCADYEPVHGLRIFVYDGTCEDPSYEKEYELCKESLKGDAPHE